jgi:hypothetical protein
MDKILDYRTKSHKNRLPHIGSGGIRVWVIKSLLAFVIITTLYLISKQPEPPTGFLRENRRFGFTAIPLRAPSDARSPGPGVVTERVDNIDYFVRTVNPSVHHIRSWISAVGAAVAVEDLYGQGCTGDAVWVDPRINRVVITPLNRPDRYGPMFLDPPPLPPQSDPNAPGSAETIAPMGVLIGDFNEDGRLDILVYYWGRSPVIFLRNSTPWNATVTKANDLFDAFELCSPARRWFTNAVTQADLTGDGHFDLIIGNYFQDGATVLDPNSSIRVEMQESMSHAFNGGGVRFFLWAGPGTNSPIHFKEASVSLEDASGRSLSPSEVGQVLHGWTLAIATANLHAGDDELSDVFLANDFGRDRLLLNHSTKDALRFRLIEGRRDLTTPKSKVLGRDSFKGMGATCGDINHDGLLGIFVSDIATEYALEESHLAFVSDPSIGRTVDERRERFSDIIKQQKYVPLRDQSETLGISRGGWSWDLKLGSFDNRLDYELVQARGFVAGHRNAAGGVGGFLKGLYIGPIQNGRWAVLHELAMANDPMLADPRFWFPCQPGDDLSGQQSLGFFVPGPQGRYFDLAKVYHSGAVSESLEFPGQNRGKKFYDPMVSRGIAIADVYGDGRLDFVVANQWEDSYVFRNTIAKENAGSCLELRLLLPLKRGQERTEVDPEYVEGRPAIGATAIIVLPQNAPGDPEKVLLQVVDGGNGHSGKSSFDLHFGLGEVFRDQVKVRLKWRRPDGIVDEDYVTLSCGKPDDLTRQFRHTLVLKWP